jgi:imidazolonepropionase-like amidohydrolase
MKNRFLLALISILTMTGAANGWILAVKNGKIFTMADGIIEDGVIIIENNRIAEVGRDIEIPSGAEIIDASDRIITPGLFDAYTHLGLVEIGATSSTVDIEEKSNPLTPQVRVIDAFNTQSELIPVTRIEGVTTVLSAPGAKNVIAGQSAVFDLYGSTVKEMIVREPAALHINFGEDPTGNWRAREKIDTRMGLVAVLRQALIDARKYEEEWADYARKSKEYEDGRNSGKKKGSGNLGEPAKPERDLGKETIVQALNRTIPVVASAHRKDDILTAINVAEEFGLELIILHGTDAYKVAETLKNKDIPVLLGPITTQPSSMEDLGAIYENAALLERAGVRFAIISGSTHNSRDLRFQTGIAVQHGLSFPAALRAMTINPAQILGVDKDLGSIEPGKMANIAIFDGDPLQPLTKVTDVIIEGRHIPLKSFQTELFEEYR